jgi:rare lipoprotein A
MRGLGVNPVDRAARGAKTSSFVKGMTLGLAAAGFLLGLVTTAQAERTVVAGPTAGDAVVPSPQKKSTVRKTAKRTRARALRVRHASVHAHKASSYKQAAPSADDQPSRAAATRSHRTFRQLGIASWYSANGRRTASGERHNDREFTAAHLTLPMQSRARVTNLSNGRSVTVRVTDRGPHKPGRIIDLSRSAADELHMTHAGVARVVVELLPPGSPSTSLPGRSIAQLPDMAN